MRCQRFYILLYFLAFTLMPMAAYAANATVKATALEAGCKATAVDVVREETGPAPQNLYKVTCQSDDGKTHSVLVECTLDDCSVLK